MDWSLCGEDGRLTEPIDLFGAFDECALSDVIVNTNPGSDLLSINLSLSSSVRGSPDMASWHLCTPLPRYNILGIQPIGCAFGVGHSGRYEFTARTDILNLLDVNTSFLAYSTESVPALCRCRL